MTTPIRPLPSTVARWMSRLRWLRWADALLAWLAMGLGLTVLLPQIPPQTSMMVAFGVLVVVSLIPRLRIAWRPVSATTTFLVSRGLRPGDRAWFVHGRDADLVLVTARHGLRVVVAKPDHEAAEGMSVRRTRVLLLPRGVLGLAVAIVLGIAGSAEPVSDVTITIGPGVVVLPLGARAQLGFQFGPVDGVMGGVKESPNHYRFFGSAESLNTTACPGARPEPVVAVASGWAIKRSMGGLSCVVC